MVSANRDLQTCDLLFKEEVSQSIVKVENRKKTKNKTKSGGHVCQKIYNIADSEKQRQHAAH